MIQLADIVDALGVVAQQERGEAQRIALPDLAMVGHVGFEAERRQRPVPPMGGVEPDPAEELVGRVVEHHEIVADVQVPVVVGPFGSDHVAIAVERRVDHSVSSLPRQNATRQHTIAAAMNDSDLCWVSAFDLAAAIAKKKVSPVEVVDATLARIDKLKELNAYVTLDADGARKAAKAAERAVGQRGVKLGPLHGVPFSVKDLIITKGIRTTFGTPLYRDNVPAEDAPSVARMKAAGAIMLGKTNTPTLGWVGVTDNLLFGVTRNPWSLGHTPGGSSGGAGAAVAAGLAPLAIGTDGGGSIRKPDLAENAPSVARMRAAGAIMLGKTNTPTLGWVGVTDNLLFGVTRNPWSLGHTPGGSSGGAGAAVAAGLAPLAIGTDGGGSIRKPAAWCGIYGLK